MYIIHVAPSHAFYIACEGYLSLIVDIICSTNLFEILK